MNSSYFAEEISMQFSNNFYTYCLIWFDKNFGIITPRQKNDKYMARQMEFSPCSCNRLLF